MENLKRIFTVAIASIMFSIGCSKDETPEPDTAQGCLNKSWGEQTQKEGDAVEAAAITFATAPNKSNCESFKAAYVDYIEALEKLKPCVIKEKDGLQVREEFEKALKDGKVEIQNLDCNQNFES